MIDAQNYPFPNFDKLSSEDQQMIRDFDADPTECILNGRMIRTAAEFVDALTELGILKPLPAAEGELCQN